MDIVLGVLKVLVGGFILFTIARLAFGAMVPRSGWAWVVLVAAMAIGNMLLHRWMGSSINPPFFTAVLFAITLLGLGTDETTPQNATSDSSRWGRRGAIAVAVGTVLGWISYVEVSQL